MVQCDTQCKLSTRTITYTVTKLEETKYTVDVELADGTKIKGSIVKGQGVVAPPPPVVCKNDATEICGTVNGYVPHAYLFTATNCNGNNNLCFHSYNTITTPQSCRSTKIDGKNLIWCSKDYANGYCAKTSADCIGDYKAEKYVRRVGQITQALSEDRQNLLVFADFESNYRVQSANLIAGTLNVLSKNCIINSDGKANCVFIISISSIDAVKNDPIRFKATLGDASA